MSPSFAQLGSALALLAIYPHDHRDIAANDCLAANYYGTYGDHSVFLPPLSCYADNALAPPTATFDAPLYPPNAQLVWVQQAALESHLQPAASLEQIDVLIASLDDLTLFDASLTPAQEPLSAPSQVVNYRHILHATSTSALLALSPANAYRLSLVIPPYWRPYALPFAPLPLLPVPTPSVDRVRTILSDLKFNPLVAKVVSNISVPQMRNDIRWLTGEDSTSGILSRHSFSSGALVAASWLQRRFEETGATCELRTFLSGFAPNVICRYPSTINTTATVLISGHYDSRGSFGSTRAPGGDDDGSGITGLLSIARTIQRTGITFRSNVELVAFAGEEQGLYGSRYYAQDLRAEDKNLTLMVQADMTAYRAPGEPLQLGLPDKIGTAEVTQLVANLSAIYSPELHVGFTPACCSDHQSFHMQGFPATQVFERAGPIADPMYHNSGDLSDREGYDFEQIKSIAKVQFATVLHVAGFDLPGSS